MKKTAGLRSLLIMFVMAFMLTAVAPVALPQSHTAMAAKKKSSKKKSSKKKSSKKSAKVDLKINTGMVTVKVGKGATLKVSGNAKKTVKWSSTSNCVKLSKKSGTKIKVKGVKEGVAAVIAKVGSSKVVCCVYVGKATYADASSKTKKALGNPIRLLASYIAKHPISVTTGNTETGQASWEGRSSDVYTYSLTVQGANLVVGVTNNESYVSTDGSSRNYASVTNMYIPTDGNPNATIAYNYTSSYSDGDNYNGNHSFAFNINAVTPGTEVAYYENEVSSNGTPWTSSEPTKRAFAYASAHLVDVLNSFLVDNQTGFTSRDIGFYAYPASHRNIGMMTSADMAAFSSYVASIRAYNQAHYDPDDDY